MSETRPKLHERLKARLQVKRSLAQSICAEAAFATLGAAERVEKPALSAPTYCFPCGKLVPDGRRQWSYRGWCCAGCAGCFGIEDAAPPPSPVTPLPSQAEPEASVAAPGYLPPQADPVPQSALDALMAPLDADLPDSRSYLSTPSEIARAARAMLSIEEPEYAGRILDACPRHLGLERAGQALGQPELADLLLAQVEIAQSDYWPTPSLGNLPPPPLSRGIGRHP